MIVPFWSWNLSDTTHVRPHTKFQLVWAINTVFTRGGHNVPPPLTQMCSWDPLTIRVKFESASTRFQPEESPSRGLLQDYEPLDRPFSSSTAGCGLVGLYSLCSCVSVCG